MDLERFPLSGRVVKLLRPLNNCGTKVELVHRRILRSIVGSCFNICSSFPDIPTISSLNRLVGRTFEILEHISRSGDTSSTGRSSSENTPRTRSGQITSRVSWTICSTDGVPEVNRTSISSDIREMTFRSLRTADGRDQRVYSPGSKLMPTRDGKSSAMS